MVFCELILFVKQKTAYEMLISDWSSDVCSSDLEINPHEPAVSSGRDRISLAESATLSVRLIMPRLLGPSIRTPPSLASATSLSCLARPSSPSSANPLLKIVTHRTRLSIQSRTAFITDRKSTRLNSSH